MITKLMLYSGLAFLIIGITTGNNMLYYFFAVHVLTLALAFSLYRRELQNSKKASRKQPEQPGRFT
jgi:hypothetical protein